MAASAIPHAQVGRAFERHAAAASPLRLRDEEIAGVDVAMVDADVARCVTSWLAGGRLDGSSREVLRRRLGDADRALTELTDPAEVTYVQRLRDLAAGVLG